MEGKRSFANEYLMREGTVDDKVYILFKEQEGIPKFLILSEWIPKYDTQGNPKTDYCVIDNLGRMI